MSRTDQKKFAVLRERLRSHGVYCDRRVTLISSRFRQLKLTYSPPFGLSEIDKLVYISNILWFATKVIDL